MVAVGRQCRGANARAQGTLVAHTFGVDRATVYRLRPWLSGGLRGDELIPGGTNAFRVHH
jgi:hypothetical protein